MMFGAAGYWWSLYIRHNISCSSLSIYLEQIDPKIFFLKFIFKPLSLLLLMHMQNCFFPSLLFSLWNIPLSSFLPSRSCQSLLSKKVFRLTHSLNTEANY